MEATVLRNDSNHLRKYTTSHPRTPVLQSVIFCRNQCYGQDGQGSLEGHNFSLQPYLDWFSEWRSIPSKKYLKSLPRIRRPKREDDHSPTSNFEVYGRVSTPGVHKTRATHLIRWSWYLCILNMEHASYHLPGAYNFVEGPRFFRNLWTQFQSEKILWRVPEVWEICEHNFSRKTNVRDHLEDLGVDGSTVCYGIIIIIIIIIIIHSSVSIITQLRWEDGQLTWFTTRTTGGLFGLHKRRGVRWIAERP
jgi:hypothetical protein